MLALAIELATATVACYATTAGRKSLVAALLITLTLLQSQIL